MIEPSPDDANGLYSQSVVLRSPGSAGTKPGAESWVIHRDYDSGQVVELEILVRDGIRRCVKFTITAPEVDGVNEELLHRSLASWMFPEPEQ